MEEIDKNLKKKIEHRKHREMIQEMVNLEVHRAVKTEIANKVEYMIETIGKDFFIRELKNIDMPKHVMERIENLLQEKFLPIIEKAYKHVDSQHKQKIHNILRQLHNLKTSDIVVVKNAVNQDYKEFLKLFPEYEGIIEHDDTVLHRKLLE